MISLKELATLAKATRDAQRRYFMDRTNEALSESKRLESKLDAAVKEVLEPRPPTLFGD